VENFRDLGGENRLFLGTIQFAPNLELRPFWDVFGLFHVERLNAALAKTGTVPRETIG
jgi:hypothetical protein